MTLTSPARTRRTSRYWWVPAAAGWTVGVIATLSLLASISPLIRWIIKVPREFVNDYIFNFPDTSFAWAFVLALLAAALAARKRIAWLILVLYMVAAVGWNVGDLITGDETIMEDIGEVIGLGFHIAAILFLLLARKEFWAKVRRGALLKAAVALVAGMAIGTLVGWGLLEFFPGTLARDDRFLYALNRVSAFAGADSSSFSGHPHVFVNALLGLFGAMALMVAAIVLFQSQRAENALTGEDESAIRGLLELYGKNDSLGYFATRRDKAVVFAPNGRAAITYRVEVGVCLASGDPVGDPKAWPQAIEAWLALCQSYGWAPGVMGASFTAAEAFREAGLNALQLGDEAILYPDNYRLSGPDMRAVRQAVTRARRAGASVRIRRHRDIGSDEMAQVIKRADAWRDTETERGFSMALGRLGDPADGDCLLVEAVQKRERRRDAVPGAVGQQRRLAGPDAPCAPIPQRHNRIDGQRAVHAVRSHRGDPDLAELRDVPVGVRTGRAARRGPGRAAVAWPAGVLLAVVAARDAVPVQHEVPARVGPPLRVLRGCPAGAAGRRRVGDRRRLSRAAVLAAKRAAAHRTPHVGAGEPGGNRAVAPRREHPGRQRAAGRPAGRRRSAAAARAGAGPDGQAQDPAGRTGSTRTRWGTRPATPSRRRSRPTAPS